MLNESFMLMRKYNELKEKRDNALKEGYVAGDGTGADAAAAAIAGLGNLMIVIIVVAVVMFLFVVSVLLSEIVLESIKCIISRLTTMHFMC